MVRLGSVVGRCGVFVFVSLLLLSINSPPVIAVSRADDLLRQGIEEIKKENYEEAVDFLVQARLLDPASSVSAYYLGLAYKLTGENAKAVEQFTAAARLKPYIKDAKVELIDILIQLDKADEALGWIGKAEEEGIYPAKTAFLKGTALARKGKDAEAVKSFEKAKGLDQSIAQAAEFQIALCYVRMKKLKQAKDRFQAAIIQDRATDLASFARHYQDIVENRMFLERPLRFTLGVFGGYDSNIVLKPLDATVASDISDQNSWFASPNLKVDYVPVLEGPWLFNAAYSVGANIYENYSTTHNFIANTIYAAPGYNFGRFAVNLVGTYSNVLLKDPSYKRYLDSFTVGPLGRTVANQNQIFELFAGYTKKDYHKPTLTPEEDRTSEGFDSYLSWTWLFKEEALLNLKYEYTYDNTRGVWWENTGHRVTANIIYPLIALLKAQLSGDVLLQNYRYENAAFNNAKRRDRTYTAVAGLNYELNRHLSAIVQYSYIRGYSNIVIYDYDRSIYMGGVELRF